MLTASTKSRIGGAAVNSDLFKHFIVAAFCIACRVSVIALTPADRIGIPLVKKLHQFCSKGSLFEQMQDKGATR